MIDIEKDNTAYNPLMASYWLQQALNTNVTALEQQAQWRQADSALIDFSIPGQNQVVFISGKQTQTWWNQTIDWTQTKGCQVRVYQTGTYEILPSLKDQIQSAVENVVVLLREIETREQFTNIPKWLFTDDIFKCLNEVELEGAIAIARYAGYEATADRILELKLDEEELEPDEQPLNLLSIKQFLGFILRHPELKEPGITITNEGNVKAIWHQSNSQIFWIEFFPNNDVRYLAFVPNVRRSDGIERTTGGSTLSDIYNRAKELHAIDWMMYASSTHS
jgi:hypothetical protein